MKFIVAFLSVLVFVFSFTSAQALDVAYEGYFRSRYNYFYNLDMNRDTGAQYRGFTDLRFRLNPTFFVSDKVRIRSSLNFFDGILGDNPFRVSPYSNPALSHDRALDPNESGVQANIARTVQTQTAYGGINVPDGMTRSAGLTPIQVRRVWGELETPYGTVKVGRMPHQFGYGIFANAGDDPSQEIGESRDRIMFDTSFGPYYVRPGMGWMVEGLLDESGDDLSEIFFVFGRKTDNHDIGFYLSYNSQEEALDEEGNGAFVTAETDFWAFDFFTRRSFGTVDIGAEFLLVTGDMVGMNLLAINAVTRAEIKRGQWNFLLEAGYSSGTTEAGLAASELKTFPFSRDYDVSLIVFEEALPGGASLKKSDGSSADGRATAPHSGAISNALYPRLRMDYNAAPSFKLGINLISPMAIESPTPIAGRWYGVEYDLLGQWILSNYWTMDFAFAHFIPGSFYKDISESHSVLLGRMGVTAKF